MEKKKIEYIVTAVFAAALVFILIKNIAGPKAKKPPAPQTDAARGTLSKTAPPNPAQAVNWGRDPFTFGKATYAATEEGMTLNGIVWDEKSPSAIINDTIVKVGEEVNGKKVTDIQKNKVIFSKDGNIYELNLTSDGSF